MNIKLPTNSHTPDQVYWVESSDGMFSSASAYDMINKNTSDVKGWKWFWKMKIPQKFKTFLWLLFLDKLATNCLRAKRGMTQSDICPCCNSAPEDLDHLFRRCVKSKRIWESIPWSHLWNLKFESPFSEWLSFYMKSRKCVSLGDSLPWSTFFCATLWQIWKDRNKMSFENKDSNSGVSYRNIISYTKEIVKAFKNSPINGSQCSLLTCWCPPIAGTIKLNTDVS